jgi:hypothetical protein
MAVAWQPKREARENVLVYGGEGTRKTSAAFSIAQKIGENKMWVVDTEGGWPVLLEDGAAPNVEVRVVVEGWREWCDAWDWARGNAKRDDWVVLDTLTQPWGYAMDYCTEKVIGKDVDEYLLGWVEDVTASKAKATGVQGSLIQLGLYDWLNPTWKKNVENRVRYPPHHLLVVCQGKSINPERADDKTKVLYGEIGVRPDSQAKVGHLSQSSVYLEVGKGGKAYYTVAKDRGRHVNGQPFPKHVEYADFGKEWLWKVAGWRPGAGAGAGTGVTG